METFVPFPSGPAALTAARFYARPTAAPEPAAGPHWSWWLFLLGVLACTFAGPACALG
ncbi:hypothetical protein ACFQ48_09905 [Hymenobacter caeli]|uniref:Uncharacterized protein n=1 Tax=Hymenobacter caeli TaxID=2735894 RepID=A0ABX2FMJ4_9BACT|nr:hypothetical protein [Hymenobacter caeli]NRT18388.1 hypothetical protein [Hymenobacter caeli]